MRRVRLHLMLLLLPLLLVQAGSAAAHDPGQEPKPLVFIIHSYDPDYVWSQRISQGVQEALRGRAVTETFYLHFSRDMDRERLRETAEGILERIDDKKPELVIAADDAAQEHFVAPYLKGRTSPQVIFCGVNAPPAKYGYPARNVSGILGRWHFRQSFDLLKAIAPRVKTVMFLTDDSESSAYVVADLKDEHRRGGPFSLTITSIERAKSFQQWQRKVHASQKQADALALGIYHALRDERTGETVSPEAVAAWTNSVNKLPSIGFSDYAIKHGQLCGVLGSAYEQGALAGSMARTVLERGIKAGSLPVRANRTGTVLLNLKTAERLGIMIPFAIIEVADVVVK